MQKLKLTKEYKSYSEYKDSGVEWLGEVPKDWSAAPLRSVAEENLKKNGDGKCQRLLSLSYGKIIEKDINSNEGLLPESFSTYQIVKEGEIVFRLTDLQNDKRSLRVGYVDRGGAGIITSAYLAISLSNALVPKFAYYLLHSYDLQKVYYGMGGGVRQTLDFYDFKYLPILLPEVSEQIKITKYLDEKTYLIDQIIEKKQKLIELLKEKRTAVINHAVTKGLDQNVEFVESGIDWVGKIPKSWQVKKLKYVAILKSGDGITSELITDEGEFPVYGGNGERGFYSKYTHNGEFVLIGRQGALCGNINYACGKFWASEHAVVAKIIDGSVPHWLGESLRIMNLNQFSVSSAQPGLAVDRINRLLLPVPTKEAQENIAEYLKKVTESTDKIISNFEKLITLLQEFKSSLISHVVTGKIKI